MTDFSDGPTPADPTVRPGAFRSLFFVPGHQPELIAKALARGADATVVDWEDAVPPAAKAAARDVTERALRDVSAGSRVYIRVNPSLSAQFDDDLEAAFALPVDGIVLPKSDDPLELARIQRLAAERGRAGFGILVGIETALGVDRCGALLAAGATAAYFGAEDYIADLGGVRTTSGTEVLYARSRVALAARLAGVPAIDQAVVAYRDDARFRSDATAGRALGYHGKICIHPRQVELASELFTPSTEEIEHARRVLDVADQGVAIVDGQMVDAVHVAMARGVLARAGISA